MKYLKSNMGKILKLVTALIILSTFTACAPKNMQFTNIGAMSLNTWLDEIAGPKLTQLMGEHPMFKNEPFLIASLSGEEIRPVQDDLTRQIRERLHHHLLNKPGVNLVWRPETNWENLSDPGNKQLEKIRYYVGISTDFDPLDNLLKVNIQILNVDEKKWVPALHLYWQGAPTAIQKQALVHNDEEKEELDTSKFNIIDGFLKQSISVSRLSTGNNQSGFMEVQLTGRNTSSSYIPLEYKVEWFNESGLEIRTILSRWTKTPAYANSEFGFKAVAPRPTAKDYRIFIRKGGN